MHCGGVSGRALGGGIWVWVWVWVGLVIGGMEMCKGTKKQTKGGRVVGCTGTVGRLGRLGRHGLGYGDVCSPSPSSYLLETCPCRDRLSWFNFDVAVSHALGSRASVLAVADSFAQETSCMRARRNISHLLHTITKFLRARWLNETFLIKITWSPGPSHNSVGPSELKRER